MEQSIRTGGDVGGNREREHQGDGAHRNAAGGVSDGRDSVRASGSFRRAQLREVGLHLQLRQDIPRPPGPPPPRPGARRNESTLHEELLRPPHPDLPPPRRPRHGRNGNDYSACSAFASALVERSIALFSSSEGCSNSDQEQPGGQRGGNGVGAEGQAAGGASGTRRHMGGAPGTDPGDHGSLRRRHGRQA